jgi:GT2 family glycosyltransferase
MNYSPFASIIIPTYDDRDRLRLCLSALMIQTIPPDQFEVIVIDNGSTEDIEGLANEFQGRVVYLNELKKGSYAARNKGLSVAKGAIIGFTDSDCIPDIHWIENGIKALSNSDAGIIGGEINLFALDPAKPNSAELYDQLFGFNQSDKIKKRHYTVTANLFTYRKIFELNGNFDETLMSGGDSEWCRRAYQKGVKIQFDPATLIAHPARSSVQELKQKAVRLTGGAKKAGKGFASLVIIKTLEQLFLILISKLTLMQKTRVIYIVLNIQICVALEFIKLVFGAEAKR